MACKGMYFFVGALMSNMLIGSHPTCWINYVYGNNGQCISVLNDSKATQVEKPSTININEYTNIMQFSKSSENGGQWIERSLLLIKQGEVLSIIPWPYWGYHCPATPNVKSVMQMQNMKYMAYMQAYF